MPMKEFVINYEWIIRLLLSGILGALIGYERHARSKEAGVRTHTIVCLASAMLMILSKYGFSDTNDYDGARLAAQVVSGIGFLGAGIIFVRHDTIKGLTTAAGIWATSGIGLCVGAGLYDIGIISTLIIMVVQLLFQNSHFTNAPKTTVHMKLRITKNASVKDITNLFEKYGYHCVENKIVGDPNKADEWLFYTEVATFKHVEPARLITDIQEAEFITHADIVE